jgi:hypothetical protein
VARLERELREAQEAETARQQKKTAAAYERLQNLIARRDKLQAQIDELAKEFGFEIETESETVTSLVLDEV